MKTLRCKSASISYSRWTAYGAAATASAFVCASSVEAEIHYSGLVNHNFANGPFAGPLDPGVTLDLNVRTGTSVGGGSFSFGAINIRGPSHNTEYGWARVKTSGAPNYRFRLVDYAWGDPGDRIRTGQKSSAGNTVDAVTESGAIGLLALGAAGLVAWRKRGGQTT